LIRILLLTFGLLFMGCAAKTPLAKVNVETMKDQAIIIGSISRDSDQANYRTRSFYIYDLDNNSVQRVINQGKENFKSFSDPFDFDDDFNYEESQGSVFVISLPEGEYILRDFYIGTGPKGHRSNYQRKIKVAKGKVYYIGDIQMSNSKKFIVSNQLDRDYEIFQKKYKGSFFEKEKINLLLVEGEFEIGNYEDNTNYELMLLPLIM